MLLITKCLSMLILTLLVAPIAMADVIQTKEIIMSDQTKIKDLQVQNDSQKAAKAALLKRAEAVNLDENSTEAQVVAAEKNK